VNTSWEFAHITISWLIGNIVIKDIPTPPTKLVPPLNGAICDEAKVVYPDDVRGRPVTTTNYAFEQRLQGTSRNFGPDFERRAGPFCITTPQERENFVRFLKTHALKSGA